MWYGGEMHSVRTLTSTAAASLAFLVGLTVNDVAHAQQAQGGVYPQTQSSGGSSLDKAQGFGEKGQVIFSADRLVPVFAYTSTTTTTRTFLGNGSVVSETESTVSQTTSAALFAFSNFTIVNTPRMSIDYAVIDHLTIGGSALLWFTPGSRIEQNGVVVDGTRTTAFGIAPRVGYDIPLGRHFSFWPRGGMTIVHVNEATRVGNNNVFTEVSDSATPIWLNLEPMFVIHPTEHFGIPLGPVVDIPLAGTYTRENNGRVERQVKPFHVGITVGILGWL